MSDTKKISYQIEENNYITDVNTGEVVATNKTSIQSVKVSKEPAFIKLYLEHLICFKGLSISINSILAELLQQCSYANINDAEGGMILYINKALKKTIASKLNLSVSRIDHSITEFVKKDLMRRLDLGKYQFNPHFFGKGEWKDIQNIRATYDYNTGEVNTEIVKAEEPKSPDLTEEQKEQLKLLAEKYDIADIIKIFNKTLNAEVDKKTVEYAETLDSEVKRAETELNTIKREMETFQQTAQAGGL